MQCHMVHAIPGRIRLRVPALKYLVDGAAQMEMYLQDQPGITAVSITRVCASVTVTYDPARWTPEALQQVFAGLSPAALQHYQSPRLVRPVPPPQSTMSWVELPIGGTLISNGSALLALGNALRPLLTSPARTPGAQTMRADDQTHH